jgi:hypothetical protein
MTATKVTETGLGRQALPERDIAGLQFQPYKEDVMKKNALKKLQLSRETLGALKSSQLNEALGGTILQREEGDINLALTSNNTRYEPCCGCA